MKHPQNDSESFVVDYYLTSTVRHVQCYVNKNVLSASLCNKLRDLSWGSTQKGNKTETRAKSMRVVETEKSGNIGEVEEGRVKRFYRELWWLLNG